MGRFCLLFLLFCAFAGRTQMPAYLHYGLRDGLPSNLVYCCIQDHNGLIWLGTDKGLVCFDGIRFHSYGMKDGLPDPEVINIQEDSQGRIWLSCFRKSPSYFLKGRFYTGKNDSLLAQIIQESASNIIFEDTDSSIWIANRGRFVYKVTDQDVSKYDFKLGVTRFDRTADGFWSLGTAIIKKQNLNGTWDSVFTINERPSLFTLKGANMHKDHILYAFSNRLVLLHWANGKMTEIDRRSKPIGRVSLDQNGDFWVCSTESGATHFENTGKNLNHSSTYLPDKKVTMMMEDRQQTRWFCTMDDGIYALPKNAPITYRCRDSSYSNNIMALASDPEGGILFGDDEGNVVRLSASGMEKKAYSSITGYNRVRRIIVLPDNSRWIATDEGLICDQNGRIIQTKIFTNPKDILQQNGKMWYGSSSRLGAVDMATFDTATFAKRRYTALGMDAEGIIWAGGIEGVYAQRDHFTEKQGVAFPALQGRIIAIQSAGPGRLWVVTPEYGLLRLGVKEGLVTDLEIVNKRLKKPIENIQAIYTEPGGRLWMATNQGVYGLDDHWNVLHFDTHQGLADNDVNAVLVQNDTLWAATVAGLTCIALKSSQATYDFASLVSGLRYRLDNRPVDSSFIASFHQTGDITLPADAVYVELKLAGLDYRNRGNLQFECVQTVQLLPFPYWTPGNLLQTLRTKLFGKKDTLTAEAGALNFGVHLAPGRYQIQVTGYSVGGIRSNKPDFITLVMRPHWYETIWFWITIWSLLALALRRIYRARIAFRELVSSASELQLQALQAQMNPHFVGNSINAIQQFFYPPDPAKASEYIALFTRLLRQTMLFSEHNFITLREELQYDLDYLKMIHLRFGERFRFEIAGAEQIPDTLPFPAMLLQPILENATLHGLAPEGISRLCVEFSYSTGGILTCTICDNGVGINEMLRRKMESPVERKSKGMEILAKKVKTINRLFAINLRLDYKDLSETDPAGHGTCVSLSFAPEKIKNPVGNAGVSV